MEALLLLAVLACPLVMGATMLLAMRRNRGDGPGSRRDEQTRESP